MCYCLIEAVCVTSSLDYHGLLVLYCCVWQRQQIWARSGLYMGMPENASQPCIKIYISSVHVWVRLAVYYKLRVFCRCCCCGRALHACVSECFLLLCQRINATLLRGCVGFVCQIPSIGCHRMLNGGVCDRQGLSEVRQPGAPDTPGLLCQLAS
jgi:hypothetical protein